MNIPPKSVRQAHLAVEPATRDNEVTTLAQVKQLIACSKQKVVIETSGGGNNNPGDGSTTVTPYPSGDFMKPYKDKLTN